jgi:CreA protein
MTTRLALAALALAAGLLPLACSSTAPAVAFPATRSGGGESLAADEPAKPAAPKPEAPKPADKPADAPAPKAAALTIKDVEWLAGEWFGKQADGSTLTEMFSRVDGTTMVGASRIIGGGKLVHSEYMEILEQDGGVIYRVTLAGDPAKLRQHTFKLTAASSGDAKSATFEDPNNAFPAKIVYALGEEGLHITLTAKGADKPAMAFDLRVRGIPGGAVKDNPLGFTVGTTVEVRVADVDKAIKWYGEMLGFPLAFKLPDSSWAEVETNVANFWIGFSKAEPVKEGEKAAANKGGGTPILSVKDVDAARKLMESRGVKFTGPTQIVADMVKLAGFVDLDGNALSLVQMMEPSAPASAPAPDKPAAPGEKSTGK